MGLSAFLFKIAPCYLLERLQFGKAEDEGYGWREEEGDSLRSAEGEDAVSVALQDIFYLTYNFQPDPSGRPTHVSTSLFSQSLTFDLLPELFSKRHGNQRCNLARNCARSSNPP